MEFRKEMIEIKDLFRVENKTNCWKCGLSLTNKRFPHSERDCDYSPIKPEHLIEATKVDDMVIDKIEIRAGYGVWELSIIFDIMKKLWKDSDTKLYRDVIRGNLNLFNEAEKIYKKKSE